MPPPVTITMDEIIPHHFWVYKSGDINSLKPTLPPTTWLARQAIRIRARLADSRSDRTDSEFNAEWRRLTNLSTQTPRLHQFFNFHTQKWETHHTI